ncbi:MAG: hypothetical protein GQ527_09965 [Bacteroidales bacterium]|nr:hypothetical protein [Bacteroidales bacterium]
MISEKINTALRFQGEINGPIISEILDDLDFKCINIDVDDSKRRKLFNIAVEMFQNLYHYTRDFSLDGYEDIEIRSVFLSFDFDDEFYYLKTQNLIKNDDADSLTKKINKVNKLDSNELRVLYKSVLSNEEFSDKGGAGLGFIDMKKRSGLPLSFNIETVDHNLSKYTLIIKVKK